MLCLSKEQTRITNTEIQEDWLYTRRRRSIRPEQVLQENPSTKKDEQ